MASARQLEYALTIVADNDPLVLLAEQGYSLGNLPEEALRGYYWQAVVEEIDNVGEVSEAALQDIIFDFILENRDGGLEKNEQ